MLSKNKLDEFDEDIDTTKTEDIDICKTEDIDDTKTEDKDEDTDNGRNKPVQVFEYIRRRRDKKKKKMVIGKKDRSSGSFGMMIIYQNHVKSGYIMMVTMHTQGLQSFTHVLVRWFLLENIKQPHQKINQTST